MPERLCFDITASALGLAHMISDRQNVQFGSTRPLPGEFKQVLDFTPFEAISRIQEREVILSLNRKEGEVKAVRWREVDKRIQFIITPREGKFEYNDIDLQALGGDIDLVITVGCKSLESAGGFYTSHKSFFENAKILNIDINPENSNFGTVNKIGKNLSLSSWILDLAEQEGIKVNQLAADALFKGILWASDGFRKEEDLQKALKKLASTGGEITSVISQMFDALTVGEMRYIGKMISNMKVNSEGIISSVIKHNDVQGVNLDRIIYPEVNLISRIKDAKIIMLLTEYEKEKILVRMYSRNDDLDLFQSLSEYTPIGNSKRVIFEQEGKIDKIESKLLADLGVSHSEGEVKKDSSQDTNRLSSILTPQDEQGSREAEQEEEDKLATEKREPLQKADELPEPIEVTSPIAMPIQPVVGPQPQMGSTFTPPPPIQPLPRAQ